ncbi:MAG: hypothetical protein K2Q01_02200 [Rickettsiales bacterium]|nr:hypothetical protein [Rickettsiales bacterium]
MAPSPGDQCFPVGTLITTGQGAQKIETLVEGDFVTAVNADGSAPEVKVLKLLRRRSELLTVVTEAGSLVTTQEHPLWRGGDVFTPAGQLKAGEQVMLWMAGAPVPVSVVMLQRGTQVVDVYNMEVEAPHVYIAQGFIVHNKAPI